MTVNPHYPDPSLKEDIPLDRTLEALQAEVPEPPGPVGRELLDERAQALAEAWSRWQQSFQEEFLHLADSMTRIPALSADPSHLHSQTVALHALREIETLGKALQKRVGHPLSNLEPNLVDQIGEVLGQAASEKARRREILEEDLLPKLRTIEAAGGKPQTGVTGPPDAPHLRLTCSLNRTAEIREPETVPREYCRPQQTERPLDADLHMRRIPPRRGRPGPCRIGGAIFAGLADAAREIRHRMDAAREAPA